MRRITFSISLFILFTLALTPFASAEWKQNTITNETTERVFVVYSTWRGPDSAKQIPRGYRTVGHYAINPSASRTFYAWANNSIYFRITKSRIPQKPANATTVSHWIHPTRAFTAVSATIGGNERPTYSTVNSNELVNSDGFLRYQNGSQITVNNTWVDTVETDEPPEDTRPDAGEGEAAGTTATETLSKTFSSTKGSWSFWRGWDLDWVDTDYRFDFSGPVTSYDISTSASELDENNVNLLSHGISDDRNDAVDVTVRILEHRFEPNEITVTVTAQIATTVSQTAGNLSVSGVPSSITSGETRTITATVTSKNGTGMPGVTVEFVESSRLIAFSSTSVTTDSSGKVSTTLRTGSKGDANFVVRAAGLSESFDLTVERDTDYTYRTYSFSSRRAEWEVRGLLGIDSGWNQEWYDEEKTQTFPGNVISAEITSMGLFVEVNHRIKVDYDRDSDGVSWSGDSVTVYARIYEHIVEPNEMDVAVRVTYEVLASSPGAPPAHPLSSETRVLQPETDSLPTFWQDLSQVPETTALLPNYPNPFNPETWIPYRLAESAEVTLSIYSLNGNRVRTLALGHQPAGFYESRSRAAYWDGRNATGERVASGVYFYTLTAGDFAATSKMLILK